MSITRPITGFQQDTAGDWIAELGCGHDQHVRHKPPFWVNTWIGTAEGRAAHLGQPLPCVQCERSELPAGHALYKRTPVFEQDDIPAGLRRDHATKPGVWGVIRVLAGQLRYVVEPPLASERLLAPGVDGIVVPEVRHRVEAEGAVRFYVEFHRVRGEPT